MFNTALYTDLYQLAMGQAYFLKDKHRAEASFDYFYRKTPFEGGYVLFCGLEDALSWLEEVSFSEDDLKYLKDQGFDARFLEYLKGFRFTGTVRSVSEGELVFPFAPILSISGPVVECQIVETFLLNTLNFQSLIATKASRIRHIAGEDSILSEFGLRRAQGYAGLQASRAAFAGGFNSTSNVLAGKTYDMPISGTMAHAFIQSYDDELKAFRDFAETRPENCVLLVDTYNTLESGVPNAITVAKEMEASGRRLMGIRLDSGDLAYLSKVARNMLDEAGLQYVKIAASNQLDEYVIRSLKEQRAAIDIYGVGTNLVVGHENGALDGVYKLCSFGGHPRIKISENLKKMNFPGDKQVYRYFDSKGFYTADAITGVDAPPPDGMAHPFEPGKKMRLNPQEARPLLKEVMKDGKRIGELRKVKDIAMAGKKNLQKLPEEHKRFDFPHVYKVGLSSEIEDLRNKLKAEKLSKYQK